MQAKSLLTTDQNLERINRTVSNLRSQGAARRTHTVTKNKKVRIIAVQACHMQADHSHSHSRVSLSHHPPRSTRTTPTTVTLMDLLEPAATSTTRRCLATNSSPRITLNLSEISWKHLVTGPAEVIALYTAASTRPRFDAMPSLRCKQENSKIWK
jgi:hypothetical protein